MLRYVAPPPRRGALYATDALQPLLFPFLATVAAPYLTPQLSISQTHCSRGLVPGEYRTGVWMTGPLFALLSQGWGGSRQRNGGPCVLYKEDCSSAKKTGGASDVWIESQNHINCLKWLHPWKTIGARNRARGGRGREADKLGFNMAMNWISNCINIQCCGVKLRRLLTGCDGEGWQPLIKRILMAVKENAFSITVIMQRSLRETL
jgi:hypothetical protein